VHRAYRVRRCAILRNRFHKKIDETIRLERNLPICRKSAGFCHFLEIPPMTLHQNYKARVNVSEKSNEIHRQVDLNCCYWAPSTFYRAGIKAVIRCRGMQFNLIGRKVKRNFRISKFHQMALSLFISLMRSLIKIVRDIISSSIR